MKKWLLISTLLNILILQIPFPKDKNTLKVEENIKFDLTTIKFNKNNKPSEKIISPLNNNLSSKINNISKSENNNNSIIYNNTNVPNSSEVQKNNFINENPKIPVATNENITPVDTKNEISQQITNTFTETVLDTSKNSEKENSNTAITNNEIQSINEKDENILLDNSVKLVKENNNLEYKIIKTTNPIYPKKAQILSLKENVKILAEFTVDIQGNIKDIVLSSDFIKYKQYEFDKAVEKALNSYKFSKIFYKNQLVEVRFKKKFEFNLK